MAKRGLHVNVYRLPDGTWRCDLKLNTTEAGEGVTVRGTSESSGRNDPQMGWIPLVMLAAQYGPKIAQLVAEARAKAAKAKAKAKAKKPKDDDDDDDVSGLSGAGRALANTRTIAGAMLGAAAAALPDYVKPSLEVLKAFEVAERRGMLPEVRKQLTDPTLRKLAAELDQMSRGQRTAMSGGGCCLADGDRGAKLRGAPRSFNALSGNPHPFSSDVANRMDRILKKDPLALQKMARALQLQRERARQGG